MKISYPGIQLMYHFWLKSFEMTQNLCLFAFYTETQTRALNRKQVDQLGFAPIPLEQGNYRPVLEPGLSE